MTAKNMLLKVLIVCALLSAYAQAEPASGTCSKGGDASCSALGPDACCGLMTITTDGKVTSEVYNCMLRAGTKVNGGSVTVGSTTSKVSCGSAGKYLEYVVSFFMVGFVAVTLF